MSAVNRTAGPLRANPLPAVVRAQFLILWRTPALLVGAVALPLVLYAVLGITKNGNTEHGTTYAAYSLAGLGAYSVGAIMVFNFGVTLAVERGQKVDLLLRASPLRPTAYLLAKAIVAVVVAAVSLVLLAALSTVAGHTGLDAARLAGLLGRLLTGSLPFLGLGMTIGYLAGPTAASPVASLVYLLCAFASGMFMPLSQLPSAIRDVARYLPTYHYAELAWGALGAADESAAGALGWLAGFTVFFFGAASRLYRRDSGRRFG